MDVLKEVRVSVVFGCDKAAQKSFDHHYGAHGYRASASTATAGKHYFYRALREQGIEKGDFVVVKTPTHGLTVAEVTDVGDLGSYNCASLKWIIAKVDLKAFVERQERAEERRKLLAKLEQMAQEERRKIEFRDILANNAEAQELLARLDALNK